MFPFPELPRPLSQISQFLRKDRVPKTRKLSKAATLSNVEASKRILLVLKRISKDDHKTAIQKALDWHWNCETHVNPPVSRLD
ncbi:hypothetical protein H0W91_01500 [Patescibacteria group bacterium]|nr:hypothetical protein [Patescibacteria group bacterium]